MFHKTPRMCALLVAAAVMLHADSRKAKEDQHVDLLRGLMAEWATVKTPLPVSRKALEFDAATGSWNKQQWQAASEGLGPAAKVGDLVQITKVEIQKDQIVLQINGGVNGGGHWYDKVQVDNGGPSQPLSGRPPEAHLPGTSITVRFSGGIGEVTSKDLKKMLKPVLDFDKHSVTEDADEELPPEIKKAVSEKKAVVGMTRDEVVMAMGRTGNKIREDHDGVETEDWIYGEPPGRITFVTFTGQKVTNVRETYAGLGGSVADIPKQ